MSLPAYLVDAAHRERQVPEHAEPSPLRERQHLREIRVNHMVIIRVVAVAVNIEEVGAAVLVAEHVYRADDKVQPRRGVGQMVGDGEIEIRLAQLHAEPERNPIAVEPHGLVILRAQRRPVVFARARRARAPDDRLDVVGEADLAQPPSDARAGPGRPW